MCMSSPRISNPIVEAAPMPSALPTATTTQSSDAANAILNQYTEAQRRRGITSTIRNTGGAAGSTGTAGSAQLLGQGGA